MKNLRLLVLSNCHYIPTFPARQPLNAELPQKYRALPCGSQIPPLPATARRQKKLDKNHHKGGSIMVNTLPFPMYTKIVENLPLRVYLIPSIAHMREINK